MYTITGVTGHVGAVAAQELLHRNAPVRAVVRDEAKRDVWVQHGAETAVADFNDRASLAQAFGGSLGAFILLPTIPTAGDAEHRQLADSIAGAIGDSGVPHVVLLSSIGADLADGTGPIRWLHHNRDGSTLWSRPASGRRSPTSSRHSTTQKSAVSCKPEVTGDASAPPGSTRHYATSSRQPAAELPRRDGSLPA